jgi:flagellar basal-body rod modification protein FlgD
MVNAEPVYSSTAATLGTTSSPRLTTKTLGKDDFLKLLITQLRNQDPLNPLDQNQFLAQTAQFTSLEHLQNISAGLEELKALGSGSEFTQAAGLLGRTVAVSGRDVDFDGRTPTPLVFTLTGGATRVDIDVLDGQGRVVRQLTTGSAPAGTSAVTWDGLDASGSRLSAGTYFYRVSASGGAGGSAPVAMAAEGVVTGVRSDGGRLLYEMGTLTVRQEDILSVR